MTDTLEQLRLEMKRLFKKLRATEDPVQRLALLDDIQKLIDESELRELQGDLATAHGVGHRTTTEVAANEQTGKSPRCKCNGTSHRHPVNRCRRAATASDGLCDACGNRERRITPGASFRRA